jgi:hypothetical protein
MVDPEERPVDGSVLVTVFATNSSVRLNVDRRETTPDALEKIETSYLISATLKDGISQTNENSRTTSAGDFAEIAESSVELKRHVYAWPEENPAPEKIIFVPPVDGLQHSEIP